MLAGNGVDSKGQNISKGIFHNTTGQQILKQNCRAKKTSPKNKPTNLFFYPDDAEILIDPDSKGQ